MDANWQDLDWDGGRGDQLRDDLIRTIKSHSTQREKGPPGPPRLPWPPAPPSVMQLWRFSRPHVAEPMSQISRLPAAGNCAPNPVATWTVVSASGASRIESAGGTTS